MSDSSLLDGWYIGLSIALGIVLALVVVVTLILHVARQLGIQNRDIGNALAVIRRHTATMADVRDINGDTSGINQELKELRAQLAVTSIGRQL